MLLLAPITDYQCIRSVKGKVFGLVRITGQNFPLICALLGRMPHYEKKGHKKFLDNPTWHKLVLEFRKRCVLLIRGSGFECKRGPSKVKDEPGTDSAGVRA